MLNVFWTLIASKKRIEKLNFSIGWLSNVKNLVLSNGCEHVQNVIQWDLNSFFFQKLTIIAQRLGATPPDPHSHWGLSPQTPVYDTFDNTSLLHTSPKLGICTF